MAEVKLYHGVRNNDIDTVQRILREYHIDDVKLNRLWGGLHTGVCTRSRWCLLHICCEKGRYECAKLLLEAGADPDITDRNGQTPLFYAVTTGWYNLTTLLLSKKADVTCCDKIGARVLHYAATTSDTRILEACLDSCADINIRDRDGKTPLLYAVSARWCYRKTLEALLQRGADVNAIDHSYSRNALQTAIMSLEDHECADGWDGGLGLEETVRLLLQANSSISNLDVRCQTAPMNIIQRYYELENNSRLTTPLKTSLMSAFQMMINMGYDVNYMNYIMMRHKHGEMLLHLAAKLGVDRQLCEIIIRYGGDVNGLDSKGMTPLHVAALHGRTQSARVLIEHGAKWHETTCHETHYYDEHISTLCTPFRLALEHYHIHFAVFLTDAGYTPSRDDCDVSERATKHLNDTIARNPFVASWWQSLMVSDDVASLFDLCVSLVRWELRGRREDMTLLPVPNQFVQYLTMASIFK